MKAWLSRLDADLSFAPSSPEEAACAELSAALPGTACRVVTDLSMEEAEAIPSPAEKQVFCTVHTLSSASPCPAVRCLNPLFPRRNTRCG